MAILAEELVLLDEANQHDMVEVVIRDIQSRGFAVDKNVEQRLNRLENELQEVEESYRQLSELKSELQDIREEIDID